LEVEKPPAPAANLILPPAAAKTAGADNPPVLAALPKQGTVEDEIPGRPRELKIDGGAGPLAFSKLLETPTAEEEDPAFMPVASADLGADRDWHSKDEEEEPDQEEETSTAS